MSARPDGSALVLTPAGVLRWRPGPVPDAAAPAWQSTPAIAKLPQRRLMRVGHLAGDVGNGAAGARIWDAATDRGSDAGTLEPGSLLEPKALALLSGRVIHVGVQGQHALQRSAWQPAAGVAEGTPEPGAGFFDARSAARVSKRRRKATDSSRRPWRWTPGGTAPRAALPSPPWWRRGWARWWTTSA